MRILAAAALLAVLTACGGSSGGGGGRTVDVTLTEFKVELSDTALQSGEYTFVAKNDGAIVHALEIEGPGVEKKTATLEPGKSAELTVTLKQGTYEFYCPVDGHKDKGMKTEIRVGGSGGGANTKTPAGNGGY
jgi:uncharacterized cupredoxin-like copper-binding protein